MNFRDLMNTLDNINKPMLSEALTLSAVIALTSGYEQDDKVRIPRLADLAKQNGLEGLVDPVTGHYVSNEGDEDDEVPFEIGQKLAQAGLLPKNARLEQAGWFDNQDVWNKANAGLVDQSSQISGQANDIADKVKQLQELFAKYVELYNKKHAAKTGAAPVAGMPPQGIIPAGAQNAMNQAATMLKGATANMPGAQAAINRLPGIQESYGMSNALIESFGYEQLNEDWKDDAGDFARGVGQGATFGLDNNMIAGAKSLFKGTKYKDELAAELDAEKQAHDRSPDLYTTGQVGGAFMPTPFSAAGLAAKGIKAGLGASKAAKATGGLARLGAGYTGGQAVDAANAYTLGTDYEPSALHQPKGSGTSQLAQLQGIINTTPDGKFGPKTQSALAAWQQKNGLPATGKPDAATYAKAGIKEGKEMQQQTVAESIASLRDRLAEIETRSDYYDYDQLDEAGLPLGAMWNGARNVAGKVADKAKNLFRGSPTTAPTTSTVSAPTANPFPSGMGGHGTTSTPAPRNSMDTSRLGSRTTTNPVAQPTADPSRLAKAGQWAKNNKGSLALGAGAAALGAGADHYLSSPGDTQGQGGGHGGHGGHGGGSYDPAVAALQQQLKAQGADLGATGPNGDGIDGIMGPLTQAAQAKFGAGAQPTAQAPAADAAGDKEMADMKAKIDALLGTISKSSNAEAQKIATDMQAKLSTMQ